MFPAIPSFPNVLRHQAALLTASVTARALYYYVAITSTNVGRRKLYANPAMNLGNAWWRYHGNGLSQAALKSALRELVGRGIAVCAYSPSTYQWSKDLYIFRFVDDTNSAEFTKHSPECANIVKKLLAKTYP